MIPVQRRHMLAVARRQVAGQAGVVLKAMTPVDQFLSSVRESFASNRAADWTRIGLFAVSGLALSIALSVWLGRRRSRRGLAGRIHDVATGAGLTTADLDHLKRMAAAVGLPVLEVMTRLAAFERATAVALVSEAPPLRPAAGSVFERVRLWRKALGFSPLPAHHWLVSTRELVAGDAVALNGLPGQVAEVNEASFAVELPTAVELVFGAIATLTIDRPNDARYLSRARLLGTEAVPGTAAVSGGGASPRRAFFGHDEEPERQQHREHVRVRVRGTVAVRIMDPATSASGAAVKAGLRTAPAATESVATTVPIEGTLVDVSAGGLSLDLTIEPVGPVRRGANVLCWFRLGDGQSAVFEALAAVVVAVEAGHRAGVQHIRLGFTALKHDERERLSSAVARHQKGLVPDAAGP